MESGVAHRSGWQHNNPINDLTRFLVAGYRLTRANPCQPRTSVRGSGLERETGAVCLVIGVSGDGIGRPATRAKALNLYTGAFSRV
jgi:hypothetical protein